MLSVTFYGVRGSTPCSDPASLRYGGNTSCVVVEAPNEDPIVFDLGTGLRYFGEAYLSRSSEPFRGTALVSHVHWDHVQGLPFFRPLTVPESRLDIVGIADRPEGIEATFASFMCPPYFPVRVADLTGHVTFKDVDDSCWQIGSALITAGRVPHVGATNGYRVDIAGVSVAYVSDHQQPLDNPTTVAESVLRLCDGVDVLIHDAQYSDEEFATRQQWGHCTIDYTFEVARQAGARTLVLFHHDPLHHDDFLDDLCVGLSSAGPRRWP